MFWDPELLGHLASMHMYHVLSCSLTRLEQASNNQMVQELNSKCLRSKAADVEVTLALQQEGAYKVRRGWHEVARPSGLGFRRK